MATYKTMAATPFVAKENSSYRNPYFSVSQRLVAIVSSTCSNPVLWW